MRLSTDNILRPNAQVVVCIKDGEVTGGVYMDRRDALIDMEEMERNDTEYSVFKAFQAPVYLEDEDEDYLAGCVEEAVEVERERIGSAMDEYLSNLAKTAQLTLRHLEALTQGVERIVNPPKPTPESVIGAYLESDDDPTADEILSALASKGFKVVEG